MAAINSLVSYASDSEEEEKDDLPESNEISQGRSVDILALKSKFLLNSAPSVTAKVSLMIASVTIVWELNFPH